MSKLYEFKEDDAYSFARHVHIQAKPRGEELQFLTCPYCHGGKSGKDKGTFGATNSKSSRLPLVINLITEPLAAEVILDKWY